jgi:acetylornithine aminotransferase
MMLNPISVDTYITDDAYLMGTYTPQPIYFSKGKGCWLTTDDGIDYLDAISGIAVTNLGHTHAAINAALIEQTSKLWHVSNTVHIRQQQLLGEKLCHLANMDNAFFCNSGAEANETALKLARLHGHKKGIKNPLVIIMSGAFHGRTLAMLSATDNPNARHGFGPLVEGFLELPFNDMNALDNLGKNKKDIVAVLIEPIQGESGVRIASPEYLNKLSTMCSDNDWLLMLDEIQSGIGRTGSWFCYQNYNLKPDIITLAKALGNGFPIGACLASGKAASLFTPGSHGSTFGGNPLGCSVALEVLQTIEKDKVLTNVKDQGHRLLNQLKCELKNISQIREIRGLGFLIGIEFENNIDDIQAAAMNNNLIINVTRHKTIRILPALIMSDEEIELLVSKLKKSIIDYFSIEEK